MRIALICSSPLRPPGAACMTCQARTGPRLLFRVEPIPLESPHGYLCRVAQAYSYNRPHWLLQLAGLLPDKGNKLLDSPRVLGRSYRIAQNGMYIPGPPSLRRKIFLRFLRWRIQLRHRKDSVLYTQILPHQSKSSGSALWHSTPFWAVAGISFGTFVALAATGIGIGMGGETVISVGGHLKT